MPEESRVDAVTCSKRCRQAKHRFRVGVAADPCDRSIRLAYADPPYPGLARKYYGCEEVDHAELVSRLASYDGWALSTSRRALKYVLSLCPDDAIVCPWVRPVRNRRAWWIVNSWEPLIVVGGRKRRVAPRGATDASSRAVHDTLIWGGRQHSHPGAMIGMKPAAFCEWMFKLLGACRGDSFDDLFPGSGAVTRAWDLYVASAGDRDTLPSRLAGAERRLLVAPGDRDAYEREKEEPGV